MVGLTERTVQAIVADLQAAGYLTRTRAGRRTRYTVAPGRPRCRSGGPLSQPQTQAPTQAAARHQPQTLNGITGKGAGQKTGNHRYLQHAAGPLAGPAVPAAARLRLRRGTSISLPP